MLLGYPVSHAVLSQKYGFAAGTYLPFYFARFVFIRQANCSYVTAEVALLTHVRYLKCLVCYI
jgi:hypothetical protein